MPLIDKLLIRDGIESDLDQITDLCRNIWDGHDFLPSVWNNWIENDVGSFIVAELKNQIIAVYHSYLLGSDSWLETLRVDESYRRQGIAKYLLDDYLERSRCLEARNVRLVTSTKNTASRNLFTGNGFDEILYPRYCSLDGKYIELTSDLMEFSMIDDSDEIYSIMNNSLIKEDLIPLWWRWWPTNSAALSEFSKNAFLIIPKLKPSSFIAVQPSKNFGYKNDYQILFFEMSTDILDDAMSFLKNQDPSVALNKIFSIPKANSRQLNILGESGFKQSTNLVVLERTLNST
jgi:N-acetylglutamate synthase-like GNAT family acetyltransferase